MNLKQSKTNRGFGLIEFRDRYNEPCSLQKSSLATEDAIWFGRDDVKPKIMAREIREDLTGWIELPLPEGADITARMHLTREQVKQLLPALQHFVETGELPKYENFSDFIKKTTP
jgi:hypothetical protein